MRLLFLLSICLTVFAQSAGDDVLMSISSGFMSGNDYLKLDASHRTAYAMGFVNGMTVAPLVLINSDSNAREAKWVQECIQQMTGNQIAEIILKHIKDNPAEWHYRLNSLGYNAMVGACKSYFPKPPRK